MSISRFLSSSPVVLNVGSTADHQTPCYLFSILCLSLNLIIELPLDAFMTDKTYF